MLRLNLLGAIHLNGDVGGNKNLAVLAYLMMEGAKGPVRRDNIVAVLWPDADQKSARGSLNTAIHSIRTKFPDLIVSQGQEELIVDWTHANCDCFEFARLSQEGRLEDAVALYRGEFAQGLHIKESPEFEDWLSKQRLAWRGQLVDVVKQLCRRAIDAADLTAATKWAEQLLDTAPEDDELVQAVLNALVERGNNAAAIRLHERYRHTLHENFGVEPSPHINGLIAQLPKSKLDDVVARIPSSIRPSSRKQSTFAVAALLIVVVFVGVRALSLWPDKAHGSPLIAATPKVAVTQFSASAPTQRSASVLNDALQWRLHDVGFDVIDAGRQDTSAIRKLAINGDGITFVIGGSVEPLAGASLVARLWLKDAATGKQIWTSEFTEKTPDAHLIATQLSEAITTEVRKAAGLAVDLGTAAADVPEASWKAVYRAREDMEAAVDMERAGALDGARTEFAAADAALVDLIRQNADWSLPWLLRARIAQNRGTIAVMSGNVRAAVPELDRGIRLLDSVPRDNRSGDILEARGVLEYRKWAFGIDGVAEAQRVLASSEKDLRAALQLGHERSDSYAALSGVMFAQGKYPEALVYAQRAYDSNIFLRHNEEILGRLFNSALQAGDDAAANQWCHEIQAQEGHQWPAVMCRIQVAGFAPGMIDGKMLQGEIENVDAPPPVKAMMQPRLKAAYAISLAQHGMKDSARAVLNGIAAGDDDELLMFNAFALAELNQAPQAHAMMERYLAKYRGTRSAVLTMRWWR